MLVIVWIGQDVEDKKKCNDFLGRLERIWDFLDSDASRKLEKSGVAEGEDIFGDTVVKLLVRERGEVWKEKA